MILEYFEPLDTGCQGLKVLCNMLGLHVFKVLSPFIRLEDFYLAGIEL